MPRTLTRWLAPAPATSPLRVVPVLTMLESRLNPVTTLYFDFGIGVGVGNSLATDATAFRDIFGAGTGTFGTGSDLTTELGATGTLEFRPLNYDYDGNGTVNAADLQLLSDDVIAIAQRAVGPYDIDVKLASATTLANAVTTVGSNAGDTTGQFDAYNFIGDFISDAYSGGSVGDNANLFGIAGADDLFAQAGNTQDEATLTFADSIYSSTTGTPGTADFNRNLAHRIAYTAVHEAAHTLTLLHTVGSATSPLPPPPVPNFTNEILMSRGDQIRFGSDTRESTNIFTRFSLLLQGATDTAASNYVNNYDVLSKDADIGLKDANRNGIPDFAYVTGSGAHDVISITRNSKSATTADVSVRAYSNSSHTTLLRTLTYSIDLTKASDGGIVIDGSAGDDDITIDANIKASFTVRGGDGTDNITLRRNSSKSARAITGFAAYGEDGDDKFTVDFANGDPLPDTATPILDGGRTATSTGNTLTLTGGTFSTVTHEMTDADSGGFSFSTGTGLLYTGLAAVSMTGQTVTDLTLTLPIGGNAASLQDDGTSGNTFSRLRSTAATASFIPTTFRNPTGSLTVNRGGSTDTLAVAALPDLTSSLVLGNTSERFASVTFNGAVTLATNKNLAAYALSTISLPNTASDLTISGSGTVDLVTNRNIVVALGASVSTATGTLTLSANRQVTAATGDFVGVEVTGTVQSTTGLVSVAGRGGNGSNGGQDGVYVLNTAVIRSTGGGSVIVTGTGGASGSTFNAGVYVLGTISATGAAGVTVTGTGGGIATGSGGGSVGVLVDGGTVSAGTGASSITGTGGAGTGNGYHGVLVSGGGVVSGGGALTVTGTGGGTGAAASSAGVLVASGGAVSALASGTLTVTGTGGAGTGADNNGVFVTGTGSALSSNNAAVDITATGGANATAFRLESGGTVSSGGGGSLTLSADSMTLAGTVKAGATANTTATLRPNTAGTPIDLGGADVLAGTLTLGLDATDLSNVQAGTLVIGRSDSGLITLSADVTAGVTAVQLVSGGGIASSSGAGAFATAGGTLSVASGGSFAPARTGTDLTSSGASFVTGSTLSVAVNGQALDTGYSQLKTSGPVDLTNLALSLSGSYIPVAGDVFTIVSAGSISGTFDGLPSGSAVTLNGVSLRVFYSSTKVDLVVNRAPAPVSAGGPYSVNEGLGLTVAAGFATDLDGDAVSYTWDVNGDGTFGDESGGTASSDGRTVAYTYAQLVALGLGDGSTSVTAAVKASDGAATATATTSLTVNNVAPTITAFSVPGTGSVGASVTSSAAATDPAGPVRDPITFNWVVTLNGGTVSTGSGFNFAFIPTQPGTYTVRMTADDGDGGIVARSSTVAVSAPTGGPTVPVAPAHPVVVASVDGTVSVTDSATNTTRTFTPYPGFPGGITVASADLNGDGYPEIVTGAGAGGGPHIKIYDGNTLAEVASFFAFAPTFTGGVSVAAGGGRIAVGAGPGGGPHVKVFDGASFSLLQSFFAFAPSFSGGVRVALGDLDNDGVADVAVSTGPGAPGPGASTQVSVFAGTTAAQLLSISPFTVGFTGGAYVAVGGGKIAVGADAGASSHVKVYDLAGNVHASFFAYDPQAFFGGVRVAFADSNADGSLELITGAGFGGGPHVKAFSVSPFGLLGERFYGDALTPAATGVFVA